MKIRTAHHRADQVIQSLERFNADLTQNLKCEKYTKMAESAFSFYRGSNHLYWHDVYRDWQFSLFGGLEDTQTWLLGDVHVHNYGAYGSHDRVLRFGLDDFDDGVIGDYQYDLWRLTISLELALREQKVKRKKADQVIDTLADAYLGAFSQDIERVADWVARPDSSDGLLRKFLEKTERKKSREKMLEKWTDLDGSGERVFKPGHPKLAVLDSVTSDALTEALSDYQATLDDHVPGHSHQHFRVKAVARRVNAGTGSLGCDRYYALIEGAATDDHDDVILDIKAQQKPAAWHAMTDREQSEYNHLFQHEGERHCRAFQALARHPDPYVGWLELDNQVFSVRERSPFKADFPVHKLTKTKHWEEMANNWGYILAASHLRGARALNDGDAEPFARAVCEQVGERRDDFKALLLNLSRAYADCVEQDYQALRVYLERGREQGTS
ncbi:DUF2252 family protein [Marinobacterium litorale]|uniref:DUF2252 family protein n=1 Tax=Marinobacterium litorale TaxID=404770 RepID=UPI000403B16A|nr:DUF2252 family protein [Marinobacterium litorale]